MYASEESAGKSFESDMIASTIIAMGAKRVLSMSDTTMDTEEGTDFTTFDIVEIKAENQSDTKNYNRMKVELRIDATLNFSNKKNMPFCYETEYPCTQWHNFQIGIRTGVTYLDKNTKKHVYHEFEKPVVVIGIDAAEGEYYQQYDIIQENLEYHMPDLIQAASDCYQDFITMNPNYRKDLEGSKLKPNPSYHMNRNCKKYREMINMRNKMDAEGESIYTDHTNDMSHMDYYDTIEK